MKADLATAKTSLLNQSNSVRHGGSEGSTPADARGFSLIEMMMVTGLLVLFAALAFPRFENTNSKIRREVRSLTVLMKRLHHLARLNRSTYRLVIDFPENDKHKYWAEVTTRKVLFANNPDGKPKDPEEIAKEQAASGFQLDTSTTKRAIELPEGVSFESLEIANREELITSGQAYIHFLPQGMAEEAALMLTDKKDLHWTIVLNPLTGQGEIVDGKTSLKDMRDK